MSSASPLAQGRNREHLISSIGTAYWAHAMGLLVSRSGMAFEIWSQDERFSSRAEVWSDAAYWTRQGCTRPVQATIPTPR